ncbi:M15 family metallopeptidase [Desulfobulbus sp.]|uniref:M15 family metallopeptidase n=1 Tax=Desulfobulbus sp. TaxID=895 RepID=UPI00286F744B|nr:M15 family metallopeptidase [Desulfobulbus sp.]
MEIKKTLFLRRLCFALACLFGTTAWGGGQEPGLPTGFVYLDRVIPDIKIELRYATAHNFVGRPIDGYLRPRCILTEKAALALKAVQDELRPFGLSLKVFDGYRPQRAVEHFVRWAEDPRDTRMQGEFYPELGKENLFKEGYIAAKSSHSRGSTVDVTLTASAAGPSDPGLDMGSGFDLFAPKSWPDSPSVPAAARAHRLLLRQLMQKHGFAPYAREWWHFTLDNEPFPTTFFDFPVH